MRVSYQQMIRLLHTQRNMLLVGHEDPDGDCLGSLLAVYRAFDGAAKNWRMVLADEVQLNLCFLPGLTRMIKPRDIDIRPESILLVDCGDPARAGAWLPPLAAGKQLYCIDHHISNDFQGSAALVEPEAAAAAEIVAALIQQAGIDPDADTALCLYSGMAADTGCFRYLNTTPRCLRLAADLLPKIDLELVRIHLFEDRTYANLKMMAVCLNHLQVECGGLLAYSWLDQASMRQYGATARDCYNIVNYTLTLSGVQVGLLFEEYADQVKVSFRCRNGYRVDTLAQRFGGGGHLLASGCKLTGNLDQALAAVLPAARELLAARPAV